VKVSADVPEWAGRELARMGRVSPREVTMAALALFALALWIFGGRWIHATAVALVTFSLMIVTGVVRWEEALGYRRAWSYLVWFATLVTLADGLNKVGFLAWFAARVSGAARDLPVMGQVAFVVVIFFVAHYMFASLTAHATALLPALLTTVVATPGLPVAVVTLALSYTLGLMGILTPSPRAPRPSTSRADIFGRGGSGPSG
jgi:L-tartrate/succinate antiporter